MDSTHQIQYKMNQASEFASQGKVLHAVQIYNSIINSHPDFVTAYFHLSELYEKQKNTNAAVNILQSLLEHNPSDSEIRFYVGKFYLRNSSWDNAIETLSLIDNKEEPVTYFFLGYAHFMLKEFEPARINFTNFINHKLQIDLVADAYLYLAKIFIQQRKFDDALKFTKKSENIYPDFWELHFIYSIIYFNKAMFEHAVTSIKKTLRLNKFELSVYELAGKIFLNAGDFVNAEKYLLKAIEKFEATPDIYISLSQTCLSRNKNNEAENYLKLALDLDPVNQSAQELKKRIFKTITKKTVPDD